PTNAGNYRASASYAGDANHSGSSGSADFTIAQATGGPASIYVLSTSATGVALSISGNGQISIPGNVYVDSNSATALSASGNARIAAAPISIVGGVSKTGTASLNHPPETATPSAADPFAYLAIPSASGTATAVSVSGNSSRTISPGVYNSISVSGNGRLT